MRKLLLSAAVCAVAFGAPSALASSNLADELIKTQNVNINSTESSYWAQPVGLTMTQLNDLLKAPQTRKLNDREYQLKLEPINAKFLDAYLEACKPVAKPTAKEDGANNNNAPKQELQEESSFFLVPTLKPSFQTITYLTDPHDLDPVTMIGKVMGVRDYKEVRKTFQTDKGYGVTELENIGAPSSTCFRTLKETTTTHMSWNLHWHLISAKDHGVQIPIELTVREIYDESKPQPEPVFNWHMKPPVISDTEIKEKSADIPQQAKPASPQQTSPTSSASPASATSTASPASPVTPAAVVVPKHSYPQWHLAPQQSLTSVDSLLSGLKPHLKHIPDFNLSGMRANFNLAVYLDIYKEWVDASHMKFQMSKEQAVTFFYANWVLSKPEVLAANKWFAISPACAPADFDAKKYLSNYPQLFDEAKLYIIPAETYAKLHYVNSGFGMGYTY